MWATPPLHIIKHNVPGLVGMVSLKPFNQLSKGAQLLALRVLAVVVLLFSLSCNHYLFLAI
jgi:hypothetical protein